MTPEQQKALALARARRRRQEAQGQGGQTEDGRSGFVGKIDSAVRGAADVLSLGFADEIAAGLGTGFGLAGDYDAELARQRGIDKADAEKRPLWRLGGQLSGGIGGGVGLARKGLSATANATRSGAGLGRTAVASAKEGATLGGAHGLGSGEGVQDRINQAAGGGALGLGAGLVAPVAVAGATKAVKRAISPLSIAPERQAAADVLRREGVTPTAGQVSGSNRLRYMESEMGGGKAAQLMDDQAEAFTDAAMRKAGASGRATPENMKSLNDRLSKEFNEVSARNTLHADQNLVDDLNGAMSEYGRVLESEQRKIVGNIAQDIVERFRAGNGTISGRDYQTIRSRLSKRANNAGRDTELGDVYREMRNALDRGMDRSIRPEDADKWSELRRQYGNMKTLERAATGGGENAALGLISPARLRVAATTGRQGQYARGEGDFAELSRAGNALLTPLPNSGTASRLSARNLGTNLSTLLGAGAGSTAGGAYGAILGALLGSAVPSVAGRGLMSRPVQRYLTNQTASEMTPEMRAIINAIAASGSGSYAGRNPLEITVNRPASLTP